MSNSPFSRFASMASSAYSGLGMGLLLGLIMGISVSPVTKTILGVLTAMLGAFLGLNGNPLSKSSDSPTDSLSAGMTALKTGSFGIAVTIGILMGIYMRTHETLSPTLTQQVERWTDAGYDLETAKKYVAWERLGIDPTSGEIMPSTEVQKKNTGVLFSTEDKKALSKSLDPDMWGNDISKGLEEVASFNNEELNSLMKLCQQHLSPDQQKTYLSTLSALVYDIEENGTDMCSLDNNYMLWPPKLHPLANILLELSSSADALAANTKTFLCSVKQK